MRIPMLAVEQLDDGLKVVLAKWTAEGGDPNFLLTFGRLPEPCQRVVRFTLPLVRSGLIEQRTKQLARLRLAQINQCHY